MPIEEQRIKALAREVALAVIEERRPIVVAGVMAEVTPMFVRVNERIDEVHDQATRLDVGQLGLYQRLDRQDKALDRIEDMTNQVCDKVTKVCEKMATRDGADGAKKGMLKVVLGLVSVGGLVQVWHKVAQWWQGVMK